MGAADVVPGVSGGTIAFISGIYLELIDSIKSVNVQALRVLRQQGLAAAWQFINGNFLLALAAGIVTSLISLAQFVQFLLHVYPLPLWSFFFGLIAGSVIYLLRQTPPAAIAHWVLFLLGIGLAVAIKVSPAVQLSGSYLSLLLAGSVAFCAMILPGISGSFILVMLGLYPAIIAAVAQMQLDILAVFACGGALGLMLFSRLLSWLLHRYQVAVIATMCGFLAGSLTIVWPWQQVMEAVVSDSGKRIVIAAKNLWPGDYALLTGQHPQTLLCVSLMAAGLLLLLGLEYLGVRYRTKTEGV